MINDIRLTNFRAFKDVSLELGKVTLLLGPNNSGKSAIISGINLLVQTARSSDREVPLLLGGELESLGTYTDMVFGNDPTVPVGICLSFSGIPQSQRFSPITPSSKLELDLLFAYRRQRRQIVLKHSKLSQLKNGSSETWVKTSYKPATDTSILTELIGEHGPVRLTKGRWTTAANHFLVSPDFTYGYRPRELEELLAYSRVVSAHQGIERQLLNIESLGPFRQLPQRFYTFTGESPRFVGSRGDNAVAILAADNSRRGARKLGLIRLISDWMNSANVASTVGLKVHTERQFEIKLRHPVTKELENFADTGFGCSQVLPVLVAGFNAPEGTTLLVQQPELHLHPRAQAELGSFLHGLYKRDVQTLVETHSEHLVLRVQRLTAEGRFRPQDIKIFYVHATSNGKEVREIRIGEDGEFLDEWPHGFFPERLEETRAMLKGPVRRKATV